MGKSSKQIQAVINQKKTRAANLEKDLKKVKGEIVRLGSQLKSAKAAESKKGGKKRR